MPALDLRKGENPAFQTAMEEFAEHAYCGYLFFGGDCEQIARITRSLRTIAEHEDAPRPVFTCDVERGLGQIVAGGNLFPPFEAIAACDKATDKARAMGEAIARECLAVGIDWLFSPVADLADVDANPIVGSRSFGAVPESVGELVAAFVEGVEGTGALSCVKHFPGHGGTIEDSHDSLPKVQHDRLRLINRDLKPFEQAFEAGASSLMTAHVAYPTLGHASLPATLDSTLIRGRLREQMGYDGLVVTDAFIMDGLKQACGGDEAKAAVLALDAGCDLILYPTENKSIVEAVAKAIEEKGWEWVAPSLTRILKRKAGLPEIPTVHWSEALTQARDLAKSLARASQRAIEKAVSDAFVQSDSMRIIVIDDDQGVEAGADFVATAKGHGKEVFLSWLAPDSSEDDREALLKLLEAESRPLCFLIRCSIKAWKGRPGLHADLADVLARAVDSAKSRACPHAVVALAGKKVMDSLPISDDAVLMAYGEGAACEEEAFKTLLSLS